MYPPLQSKPISAKIKGKATLSNVDVNEKSVDAMSAFEELDSRLDASSAGFVKNGVYVI